MLSSPVIFPEFTSIETNAFDLIARSAVIAHIFNNKRDMVSTIEKEFNITLNVSIDNSLDADTFILKQGDHINFNAYKPLQNSGCQIVNSRDKEAGKLPGNFWLTKWLSRPFGL
ncbi:hypothetical protein [Wolbachia endosymbiont of Diaphorina citri]|uniref:hypothetical protein n=1 Tax=Wolbachia endosymbiont of Diaphorina citri TaxID=116598 RepID=UPI00390824A6